MSFEINNSWLNLTNQSMTNENDERFNFKATSEDFFAREGERFIREDPFLPFSNSALTDITQTEDQSWTNEQNIGSPGCSTTTFFMAKSSTPDEMLNALLSGKTDGIPSKENQQPTCLRNLSTNGWNESSLMNKKSVSGLNLRQQKDSPFNENCNTIVKKSKTVLTPTQPVKGEVSRTLFNMKPQSTSTSVNCDMLNLSQNSNDNRRHSLDLSDSMSILSLHCHHNHHLNGNIYSNITSNDDVSTVNTETQTSQLGSTGAGGSSTSSSSSSAHSSRTPTHHQQQQQQHALPSTHFPPWTSHQHPPTLFYPVVSYHPIYSYAPSTSTTIPHQPPTPLCIHPPATTISSSSDIYNHHHDINSPIITSLHSQPSDDKSSTTSFQRNSRSSSSSLLSANSQRLSQHQLPEQHDHWWLDIPSSTIFRMPSCYAHQTSSVDIPIKNNGSVDITLSVNIHKWDLISDASCTPTDHQQIVPFQLDKLEYTVKSQQEIHIKIRFSPYQIGNYQCKLNVKCQFCPSYQPPSTTSLVTLVGVCHDPRIEYPILLSSVKDQQQQQRNMNDNSIHRISSQSQVSDLSLASTTAQSDGDLTSTSQHKQKDAILDIVNQIGIEQNILDFGQVYLNDDLSSNSKTLKLTIKNYSRTDPCDVDITEPHLPFCISVRRATIREKSFVKLTCKFRPKKIGLYSENVILNIKRRNNFKTTITLTGRCLTGDIPTILQDSIEIEE